MNKRAWILIGLFVGLGLAYILLFTEWIRPEPIQIASQVRAAIHPPRFGRPPPKGNGTNQPPMKMDAMVKNDAKPGATLKTNLVVRTNMVARRTEVRRVQLPDWGKLDQTPGGVANVTFSLDGMFSLTALRVEDIPADGSEPTVLWKLAGKSLPTSTLLYGRDPEGMKPLTPGAKAEALVAGVPYRLIIEAGRRRGTNRFRTMPFAAQ